MTSNKQDPFSSMQKPTGGLSSTSLSAGNTAMGHDLRGPSEPYNMEVQQETLGQAEARTRIASEIEAGEMHQRVNTP